MYLLDTNHCSYLINNNPQVVATAQSYAQDTFGISIISYGELLYMTEKSERREINLQVVQAFLTEIDIYLINKEIAEIYSQLKNRIFRQFAPKEKNKRRSTRIQDLGFDDNDLWITATAIYHNITLVSADSDFTRIQQVYSFSLESWI
ncbi:MAG: type II toxin-antitoxin system VapC family toxin [Nostoc sp.]|uniref:type II toxin-antitoxin system VapC family toxin n=1 Tax=Nostoc sp. TaxID=1180 RepID=UPI002FF70C98